MEAITILKNESNNHRLMQIDLDMLANSEEELEDVYDIIAVELRKMKKPFPGSKRNNNCMMKANYKYVSH